MTLFNQLDFKCLEHLFLLNQLKKNQFSNFCLRFDLYFFWLSGKQPLEICTQAKLFRSKEKFIII